MKLKIGNIKENNDQLRPKPDNGRYILFAAKPAVVYPEQITEVSIGCDISIPGGYIGILTPYSSPLLDDRCLLVEAGGIVSGLFNVVRMRKGVGGSVKFKVMDPIAYLYILKKEEVEMAYY